MRVRDNVVRLKCLGNVEGPRWLDSRTAEGKVGLIKNYAEAGATGAKWRAQGVKRKTVCSVILLHCAINRARVS